MVDEVIPSEKILQKSIEKAKILGSYPQEAFRMIKRNRIETVEEEIIKRLHEKEQYFVECWYAEKTRQRLKEAIKKF